MNKPEDKVLSNKNIKVSTKPELMAPAGDWTMMTASVKNGADAVYFGVDKLNMRSKADNFKISDLTQITSFCKDYNVKTYLTLNSIIKEDEISDIDEIISSAKNTGIDRIICWDLSVIQKCKGYNMPFCISTQASISNSSSASFYKSLGAVRIVLARECTLEEIKKIRITIDLEIETFVHGAMCIAVSGRCFMSHHLFGKSANQGECIQPCRREYEVYDSSIDKSMIIGTDYVLSPKDLCTIEYLDQLIESGINSFKIEGRKRSPEYVAKAVSVYRRGIDLYFENKLDKNVKKELLAELGTVYNRGFSSGFYFDTPSSEDYADIYGSKATTRKEYLGRVINYYKKANAVYIQLETGTIEVSENILIIGPTSGVVELKIEKIIKDDISVSTAIKGERVTFPCGELVRPHDSVYKIVASQPGI
jgi:putative protease